MVCTSEGDRYVPADTGDTEGRDVRISDSAATCNAARATTTAWSPL